MADYFSSTDTQEPPKLADWGFVVSAHSNMNSVEPKPEYGPLGWAENFGKSAMLVAGSGAAQLYNIAPTIGSWIGMNIPEANFAKMVTDYDTDFSNYYAAHQQGIDAWGFVASSIVPATLGAKAVRAVNWGSQTMKVAIEVGDGGALTSASLGLRPSLQAKYIVDAAKQITETGNPFNLLEANTLKAVAAGFGQQAVENYAAVLAVNATMYNSPVLKDQTIQDMFWEGMIFGAIGTGIGGVIEGIATKSVIKGAAKQAESTLDPWNYAKLPAGGEGQAFSDKILLRIDAVDTLPEVPLEHPYFDRAVATRKKTLESLRQDTRSLYQQWTGEDTVLAQAATDLTLAVDKHQNIANLLDAKAITRFNKVAPEELREKEILSKLKNGIATEEEVDEMMRTSITYVKLRGDGMNSVLSERPAIVSIFDRVGKNTDIRIDESGVFLGRGRKYLQQDSPYVDYNITGLSSDHVEARRRWFDAQPSLATREETIYVHANDLPKLEKAVKDGVKEIHVIPESGKISEAIPLRSAEQILQYTIERKGVLAEHLLSGKAGKVVYSLDELADKLTSITGVRFNWNTALPDANGFFVPFIKELEGLGKFNADAIALNPETLLKANGKLARSLMQVAQTLKHEEGHRIFQNMLDARGVSRLNLNWALAMPELYDSLVTLSKAARPATWKNPELHAYVNMRHELFADAFGYASLHPEVLAKHPELNQLIGHLVRPIDGLALQGLAQRMGTRSVEEVAKIVDVTPDTLSQGKLLRGSNENFFASDLYRKQYKEMLERNGTRASEQLEDPMLLPSVMKVVTVRDKLNLEGIEVSGMAAVMQRAAEWERQATLAATQVLGREFPSWTMPVVNKYDDDSAKILAAANGNYGSSGAIAQYVGVLTHKTIDKVKQTISDSITPHLNRLVGKTEAALEWSVLNETMRSLPQKYVLKSETLENSSVRWFLAYDGADVGVPAIIPIKHAETLAVVQEHMRLNAKNLTDLSLIKSTRGLQDTRNPEYFYPIPRDLKQTPFFAHVVDDSITGTGHSSMLYAANERDLEALIAQVRKVMPDSWKILTRKDAENYFKAHGQFEFERSLNENYIDTELKRRGVSFSKLPLTDPVRIGQQVLDWHLSKSANVVREAVALRYSRQFDALYAAADTATGAATSRRGYISQAEAAAASVDNPSLSLIKMALDVTKKTEYPFWTSVNRMLDSGASRIAYEINNFIKGNATITDVQLDKLNSTLMDLGYSNVLVTKEIYRAVNGKVPEGVLTGIVNKGNAILATLGLRWDFFNALNNIIGHPVLYGTELSSLLKAIKEGNTALAGDLANLAHVKMPGSDLSYLSPTKLIADSIHDFHNPALRQWYKDLGFSTRLSEQYDQVIDELAISLAAGKNPNWEHLAKKAATVGNVGERITGNTFAEEFNRFVAANTARKLGELAIKHNVMAADMLPVYINTFVNRTNGVYLASQRPLLFQGPLGQAMGLFQTYQFNLLQQLLRHVENKDMKAVATLAGMQASIYGMNGLPAFNALNTHVIATASGNPQHKDIYNMNYSLAGKEAGEWITYGFGSNVLGLLHPDLKNNIYSRGDINPRQFTIVPVNPLDLPIVNASTKFVGTLFQSIQQMGNGAGVRPAFLNALSHNGISRPLAGFAQVLGGATSPTGQVVSTSNKGNILMSHDLVTFSSALRLLGAKPLDEALTNDLLYRQNSYRSAETSRRDTLGDALKMKIMYGDQITEADINYFASNYVRAGGRQDKFYQFMASQYKNATVPQAEQLKQGLSSWRNDQIQLLLGGAETK